jgi:hypothetical protein
MSIRDEMNKMREDLKYQKYKEDTQKKKKEWAVPTKWKSVYNKSTKKSNENKVLVQYLTSRGTELPPMLLPLYSGNLIIYKDKVHEFDPRALYNLRVGNKMYKKLIIREMDRKPVANLDWSDVKARGDTTRNDEILLKMLRLAMIEKVKKQASAWMWYALGGLVALGVGYYLLKG